MPTYEVVIYEKIAHTISVTADNEHDAVSASYEFYRDDNEQFGIVEYDSESMGFDSHTVELIEEND